MQATLTGTKVVTLTVKVQQDSDPIDPRVDWDHIGTMVCSHRNYRLGDEQESDGRAVLENIAIELGTLPLHIVNEAEDEQVMGAIRHDAVILPLYLYDHSGITMRCQPFSCPWDSGQVGYIYVKKGTKGMADDELERILKDEVESYDTYLTSNIYGATITKKTVITDEDGDEYENERDLESCWGFYGDPKDSGIKEFIAETNKELAEGIDDYGESEYTITLE
jgi:hypothetical protein